MHENIERFKELFKERFERGFGKFANWFLILNLFLYALACVVASGPVGPVGYVEFLYHCTRWRLHA